MVEGKGRLEKGVSLDPIKETLVRLIRAEGRGAGDEVSYGGCEIESAFNGVRKGSEEEAILSVAYFFGLGVSYGARSYFLFAPVFFLGVPNLFCTNTANPSALNPLGFQTIQKLVNTNPLHSPHSPIPPFFFFFFLFSLQSHSPQSQFTHKSPAETPTHISD